VCNTTIQKYNATSNTCYCTNTKYVVDPNNPYKCVLKLACKKGYTYDSLTNKCVLIKKKSTSLINGISFE